MAFRIGQKVVCVDAPGGDRGALIRVAQMAKAAAEMELGFAASPDFSPQEMLDAANEALAASPPAALQAGEDLRAELAAAQAKVALAIQGIRDFTEGNYENPRQHRPEPCAHGQRWYEGCQSCDDAFMENLASALSSRVWQNTGRGVITRCAAHEGLQRVTDQDGEDHAAPACTMLYSALCRAAKALGYREAWTYTLPHESGRSLKGAGFIDMGMTDGGEHDRPSRRRKAAVNPAPKRRWLRRLAA